MPGGEPGPGRAAVPADVGERLTDGEVPRALDGLGEARQLDVGRDGYGGPVGGVDEGRAEPVVREDPGVDAVDQLPQLGQDLTGLRVGLRQLVGQRARRRVEPGQAEGHGEGDQALLGAVVQIALDPAPLGLEGVDEAGPGGDDLPDRPRLRVARGEQGPGEGGAGTGDGGEGVGERDEEEGAEERGGEGLGVGGDQVRLDDLRLLAVRRELERGAEQRQGQADADGEREEVERPQDGSEQQGVPELPPGRLLPARSRSQATRPGAAGTRCGSGAGSRSTSRSRRRSTPPTAGPESRSSGSPTSTSEKAPSTRNTRQRTAPRTAPVPRYPTTRQGQELRRNRGRASAGQGVRASMGAR